MDELCTKLQLDPHRLSLRLRRVNSHRKYREAEAMSTYPGWTASRDKVVVVQQTALEVVLEVVHRFQSVCDLVVVLEVGRMFLFVCGQVAGLVEAHILDFD